MATVERIAPQHIEGFRHAVAVVACEQRHLALLEAPPVKNSIEFALGNIRDGNPHFVALEGGKVIGWCDIVRKNMVVRRHGGLLGMGVLPEFRSQGIGTLLIAAALAEGGPRQNHAGGTHSLQARRNRPETL
jgi:ribosomal protein S18 acetylase RimI-like enzyme